MVNFPGRDRRRRVLKDEVLSASSNYANLRASDDDFADDAPRYSDAAGVENHPQVTDFIPRRYTSIAMLVGVGAVSTAVLAAAQYFAVPALAARGIRGGEAFNLSSTGSIASWIAAVVTLLASAACMLTYSIRRHRIDDFRGRYRVWLGAAVVCLVLSANSVAGFHQIAADALGQLTGWSALRDGAAWWMLLAALPLAWITVRALLDVRECRVAAASLVAALVCYSISAATYLGIVQVGDTETRSIASGGSLLLGHWFVLASVVSYARFVVLDAQGLVTVRRRTKAERSTPKATSKTDSDSQSTTAKKAATASASTTSYSRPTTPIQTVKTPADSSRWLDGSRPESKRYDEDTDDDEDSSDGTRKLSKTDRKKLRKLKTEGRAA